MAVIHLFRNKQFLLAALFVALSVWSAMFALAPFLGDAQAEVVTKVLGVSDNPGAIPESADDEPVVVLGFLPVHEDKRIVLSAALEAALIEEIGRAQHEAEVYPVVSEPSGAGNEPVVLTAVSVPVVPVETYTTPEPEPEVKKRAVPAADAESVSDSNKQKSALQKSQPVKPASAKITQAGTYRMEVPSIKVNMKIVEGQNAKKALAAGAWHLPGSGDPLGTQGNNMVLTCHRYMYTSGPNTCFNLDQVKKGEKIVIIWNGETHEYVIDDISIVTPDTIEVLDETDYKKVTLITCHPKYSTEKRLVVSARKV